MARKDDPKRSPQYSSLEEYRRAFFPQSPDAPMGEAVDPGTFGTQVAREALKKVLEGGDQIKKDKKQQKP